MSTPEPKQRTKERASRIALDYYKRPDKIIFAKRLLAIAAVLIAIAWLAIGLLRHDESSYSPGQLAWAHASLDSQCAACHVDFSAVRGDAWMAGGPDAARTLNRQCSRCHAAAEHHAARTSGEKSCASCHQDHQGRQAILTRVANQSCTDCHASLKDHSRRSVQQYADVTSFDGQHHPEFRSIAPDLHAIARDPGSLKFSHRRHMALGLTFGPLDRSDAITLETIPASSRSEYRQFADEKGLVQLGCASCHEPDATPHGPAPPKSTSPEKTAAGVGAYMAPINFERHCQACHPLRFEQAKDDSLAASESHSIPHRLGSDQMALYLERAYAAQFLEKDASLLGQAAPRGRDLPNQTKLTLEVTLREQLNQSIGDASTRLRTVCSKCHDFSGGQPSGNKLPPIVPVNVPRVWLKHARFDHAAHRATACRDCHVSKSLDAGRPAWADRLPEGQTTIEGALDNHELLIPGMQKCLECHGPIVRTGNETRGGARVDCAECHWYHGGQETPSGETAAVGDWLHGLTRGTRPVAERFAIPSLLTEQVRAIESLVP